MEYKVFKSIQLELHRELRAFPLKILENFKIRNSNSANAPKCLRHKLMLNLLKDYSLEYVTELLGVALLTATRIINNLP